MTKNRWEEYKEKNGVTVFDMFKENTDKASSELRDSRYLTCLSCPQLIHLTKQCKQCGCFMVLKTTLQAAKCPIGKW